MPVVFHIGFAGGRVLYPAGLSAERAAEVDAEITARLVVALRGLPGRLGLEERHFLCGISQVAIGGDMHFTRACAEAGVPQRIFLPQNRTDFLEGRGTESGEADFTPVEKAEALRLLALPHVIQERVVSDSAGRTDRFEDTNLEILRASDACICLLRADAEGKGGGTLELLRDARAIGKPVLEIRVEVDAAGGVAFTDTWHMPEREWSPPALAHDFEGACLDPAAVVRQPGGVPVGMDAYLGAMKALGSEIAKWRRGLFKKIALTVIGAHVLATLCATAVLKFPESPAAQWLLGLELLLLLAGFLTHQWLHHAHVVRVWATSRLAAEIARSVEAMHEIHCHLGYLFSLPFPEPLRPLLRTVNVLHLAATRPHAAGGGGSYEQRRDHYVKERLDRPVDGQRDYYKREALHARRKLKHASLTFLVSSSVAFLATLVKFIGGFAHFHPPGIMGILAIVLPTLAVAALSLAASFDLEARLHTFEETSAYLESIRPYFDAVHSDRSLVHLVLQAEARLLGETVNWFSRRSFTGVT